ncbi:hypothetical protein [Frigoriglobus tundricola]|uniref:Uncharacterized protein n=1 Tax=Frigoriglobus tundricola TaxID=2774151 RepID=A0A6M5YTF2_9BACT|nr:hypothetical protein [Frigoriglobus tundricola]QJW97129.1 hypothetical protein FTUN_4694 [Frigoriglobus tundricola]
MADGIGVLICVMVFFLPIGLLLAAVILRGGVSLANKCLPRLSERTTGDWDEDEDEDDYERPVRRRAAALIPEPGVGKAMGIVFTNFIIGVIASIPISVAMGVGLGNMNGGQGDPVMSLLASLVQLPIGFLIAAGIRAGMLPTSFARACLVVLFEYLIVLVIGLVIAVPLGVLALLLSR